MEKKPHKKETSSQKRKTLNSYIKYSGLAFQMGISIALAAWLGLKADSYFDLSKPFITGALCLLVIFGNFYLIFKSLTSDL